MDLPQLKKQLSKDLNKASNSKDLQDLKIKYLGKKGKISLLSKDLGKLSQSERPKVGKAINLLRVFFEEQSKILSKEIEQQEINAILEKESIDISLPVESENFGNLHPITKTMNYAIQIFESLKFECVEGPEIEDDFHNFTALNIPDTHPARAMHDTFYLADNNLLRTHTSSVQVRVMDNENPPIRIIAPGKVYRKDSDITHTPMFHQIEGLYIDKDISFSNLKSIINIFLKSFFEEDELKIRFRPSYFPFTEPSAEVDIEYIDSKGNKNWLEILGCGMVHPNVLDMANIDSSIYSGYAFGLGVERLAMLKLGITDLRLFYENDLRFLKQFQRT